MGKSYIESSLKRFLKRKVKVTLGLVVTFLITGNCLFAVTELDPNNPNSGVTDGKVIVKNENKEFTFKGNNTLTENNVSNAEGAIKVENGQLKLNLEENSVLNVENLKSGIGINIENNGNLSIIGKGKTQLNISSDGAEDSLEAIVLNDSIATINVDSIDIKGSNGGINLQIKETGKRSKMTINGSSFNVTSSEGRAIYIHGSDFTADADDINVSGGDRGIALGYGSTLNINGKDGEKTAAKTFNINSNKGIGLSINTSKTAINADNIEIHGKTNGIMAESTENSIENWTKITGETFKVYGENKKGIVATNTEIAVDVNDFYSYGGESGISSYRNAIIAINGNKANITGGSYGIEANNNGEIKIGVTEDENGREKITPIDDLKIVGTDADSKGINASNSGKIEIHSKKIDVSGKKYGAYIYNGGEIKIDGNYLNILSEDIGILSWKGKTSINSKNTNISGKNYGIRAYELNGIVKIGVTEDENGREKITPIDDLKIVGTDADSKGINASNSGKIEIHSKKIDVSGKKYGAYIYNGGEIKIDGNYLNILSEDIGILSWKGKTSINSKNTNISGKNYGIRAYELNGIVKIGVIEDENGREEITSIDDLKIVGTEGIGVLADNSGKVDIYSKKIDIYGETLGIKASNGVVNLEGDYLTVVTGKTHSLKVENGGKINLNGKSRHIILGNILSIGEKSFINVDGENNYIHTFDSNNNLLVEAENSGEIGLNLTNGFIAGIINDNRQANSAGTVKLNLDNGRWESIGKGSVTEVNLTNGGTIKFVDKASSIDIENLKGNGNGTFEMTVNSDDKSDGNMIYVQNSEGGKYQINLQNSDLSKIKVGDKIRFATIGKDAKDKNLEFEVLSVKEKGIKDVSFTVGYEDFKTGDSDNTVYNDGSDKSGNEYVEKNYENGENWYLTREEEKPNPNPDENINDIGKTVIEMARANYASAVYMDNLNKRLGDMSFAEGNSGLWVRMRNDRVGEDKEYRLHNYMTQIGYDKTYNLDEGKEYRGAALEYTRGDMKYKNLNGKTEMDRYMFTVYDTRVYNSGLYADYTGRAGYMSSDFEVTGRETGAKADGDYHNLVLGAGAEFGKRYDFGETSYFEPQVQLQYTYIDDADYTTSQDTKVNYEEIHSLIGRAGIRLGHDFYKENSKDNTIYLKADINHEFLGEQDIKAQDVTGTINKTYENDNTWYDIGIGGAKNLTENLYVYADVERQFGEERDNSWQFNLGFRYKFGSLKDFTFNAANLFDFDKSEVKPEGKEMIKNASEIMNAKKVKGTLLIEGHTDWTGSEEYNQILSEKRAKAVEEAFKENVTNENIKYETKGYGETKPVADNKTKEGRAKNRRVEVNYIK